MWVLTRGAKGRATFWEPSTGRRVPQEEAGEGQGAGPEYKTIG